MTLPDILLEELQHVTGYNPETFIAAHNEAAPPVSVRLNPCKPVSELTLNEKVQWCRSGYYLPERPVFTLDPLFHAGTYYVQEASSMFLERAWQTVAAGRQGLRVLDLCAAPGGKSTHLASLMSEDSLLISNEVIRTRATILEENITRWGYLNTWVTANDPAAFGFLKEYFDVVVVDAPCSGSGLFRKDPDALKEWSPENVQLCAGRQKRIIADIWESIAGSGFLIYATCSYSPQEDEEILDWLAGTYDVEAVSLDLSGTEGIIETSSHNHKLPGYRFMPDRVKGEGFFMAVVQKKGNSPTSQIGKAKNVKTNLDAAAKGLLENVPISCVPFDKQYFSAIRPEHENDWAAMQGKLYFRKTGTMLGEPTKKEWLPAHDIALSVHRSGTLPVLEVDRNTALQYLSRTDFHEKSMSSGWHIVTYNGFGLGWAKVLHNRINNYLPKQLRIRMQIPNT